MAKNLTSLKKSLAAEFNSAVSSQKAVIANQLVQNLKDATPVDTGNARDGWEYKDGKISNPVDYIDRLNDGASNQAPAFFIEQTLLSHPGVKPGGTIVRSL